MTDRIHPIQCIIPPHISKEIAERGSPTQPEQALRSLGTGAAIAVRLPNTTTLQQTTVHVSVFA
jgi:hypothetical protein